MAKYIEREALAEFLKGEMQQCEAELAESNGEDDRYEQAVESRMLGLVEAWRKVTNTAAADVVAVRHGVWQEKGGDIFCSVCGIDNDAHGVERFNYCPNCGAKMDGKGECE